MPSFLLNTAMLSLTAILSLNIKPVHAVHWWVVAYDGYDCPYTTGSHDWNWKGADGSCHSLLTPNNDGGTNCVYGTYTSDQGASSAVSCDGADVAPAAYSLTYMDGVSGGGSCTFYSGDGCTGQTENIGFVNNSTNCFNFDFAVTSFACEGVAGQ